MYAVSDPPAITTSHLQALKGLLEATTDLAPSLFGSSDSRRPVLPHGSARAAVQGTKRSAWKIRDRIHRGCRDLQVLLCNGTSVRDVPPLEKSEDNEEDRPTGWEAVVLIGEIERAVRGASERRAARKAGTSILGTKMIRRVWRTAARWGIEETFDVDPPNPDRALPDALFDRLLEALLWRLPMTPGTAFGSEDQRAALQQRLGSRPGAQETESVLPELVQDWKRCCRMASEIQRTKPGPSGPDGQPDSGSKSGESPTADAAAGRTPGATRRPLRRSNQGRGSASEVGIYQSLRAIDRASQAPEADLRQEGSKAALRVLIERGAQRLLRTQSEWQSAERALFSTPK